MLIVSKREQSSGRQSLHWCTLVSTKIILVTSGSQSVYEIYFSVQIKAK